MTGRGWAEGPADRYQRVLLGPSLDEQIAPGDPVRLLDAILRAIEWTEWEKEYSHGGRGRPPIHPRLVAGCILYGMINHIRSSRQLETATRMRLDFRWFLDGLTIDHSTLSIFRKKFGGQLEDLLRQITNQARALMKRGPKQIILDGTTMRANSDRHGARTAARLTKTLEELQKDFDQIMAEMAALDESDETDTASAQALAKRLGQLKKQQHKIEEALKVARQRDEAKRKKEGKNAKAVRVPVTDPESMILPNKDGGHAPNYVPVAGIDGQTGTVVYAAVAVGGDEAGTVQAAAEASEEKPEQMLFDTNFVSGENLDYLDNNGIEALAPSDAAKVDNPANRPDYTQPVDDEQIERLQKRKGKLPKTFFAYDNESDVYHCPMGRPLTFESRLKRPKKGGGHRVIRQYLCADCSDCPLAGKCLHRNSKARRVSRDQYEPLREGLGKRMQGDAAKKAYSKRAPEIEGTFGCIKGPPMGIRQFLLRGHEKVTTEWRWICSSFSLRRLMNLLVANRQGGQDAASSACSDTSTAVSPTCSCWVTATCRPYLQFAA